MDILVIFGSKIEDLVGEKVRPDVLGAFVLNLENGSLLLLKFQLLCHTSMLGLLFQLPRVFGGFVDLYTTLDNALQPLFVAGKAVEEPP